MNKREFNKLLNKISTNKTLTVSKISLLTEEEKLQMVYWIIRHRGPVVKELIPESLDKSWLFSMGYMYETKGKNYTFVHTCENIIK